MNKSQKSILNAMAALLNMAVTSVVGLVLGRTILSSYGSEYNGINSTITQIVNTIMVLEGGFTLASNVALFQPFAQKDYNTINGILSATKKRFMSVGGIAFIVGIIIALIYPLTVSSSMPYIEFVMLMLTVLIPSCFNLGVNMKHRCVLLTDQKEYIISLSSSITYTIGNLVAIMVMRMGASLVIARIVIMISLLANYIFIGIYCRLKYNFIDYSVEPAYDKIKGTRNVIALKLTSIAYTTLPIITISMIPESGALLASIYAVYKSIISMVKNCLSSITNAPRLGFGALLAEGREDDAKRLFGQYELITNLGICIILGTTCLLIMPFVDIYTKGINDANYHDVMLASIMLTTAYLETLHIPSGQIIQMSGRFKASRNIQSAACVLLVVTLIVGGVTSGLYGIVTSTLIAASFLAVAEIGYVRTRIFKNHFVELLKNAVPSCVICVGCCAIGFSNLIKVGTYFEFIIAGIISVIIITIISTLIYYVINREQFLNTLTLLRQIIKKK